jgi:hypothetical protein
MTFFFSQENSIFEAPQGPFSAQTKAQNTPHCCATYPASMTLTESGWNVVRGGLFSSWSK